MFPLSDNQRAIWFDQQLFPLTALYNVSAYARIRGAVDPATLEKAINILVAQHDAFRTVFSETESVPEQKFLPVDALAPCILGYHDFSTAPDPEAACQDWMHASATVPLPYRENELYVFTLLKKSATEYFWHLKLHHTIADAWSVFLVIQQTALIYEGLVSGTPDFSAFFSSYTDYIRDDLAYRASALYPEDQHYWQQRFAEVPAATAIGIKDGNSAIAGQSMRKTLYLDRPLYTRLQQLARQTGATTFHAFSALLYVYFSRIHQNADLVIGVPLVNRSTEQFRNTIGLFTGILPFRIQAPASSSFRDLVTRVKQDFLEDRAHQRFPVDEVFRIVRSKDPDQASLYDITLSFEKQELDIPFAGFTSETVALAHQAERMPLAVFVRENSSGKPVKIDFDFNLGCWDEHYSATFLEAFGNLVETVVDHPELEIRKLPLVTESTRHALLDPGPAPVLPDETLVSAFEKAVELYSDHTALVYEGRHFSYTALNARVNALAHYLRKHYAVQPDEIVALLLPKSDLAVIAILGILKSGAAYLPIDPAYPEERKQYMLEQSGARLLLTVTSSELPGFAGGVVWMDQELYLEERSDNPVRVNTPEHTSYIIYTSGSTGRPKGAVLRHAGVVNIVRQYQASLRISPSENCLQFASLSFDASVMEIFIAFFAGAALYPVSKDIIGDFERFKSFIAEHDIKILMLPPSYLRNLDKSALSGVRTLLTAGEPAIPRSELNLREDQEYYNVYGPTECSVCVTIYKETRNNAIVPIGRPVGNIRIFILDRHLEPLPYGVPGELFIAGVGLAKGYKDNPELTAEKFITAPFAPDQVLYRTGDIGRWLSDGNIEYLGRIDDQVKIRGHRIEPGEIEATLSLHPAVKNVAVVVHEKTPGEKGLYAFVLAPGLESTDVLYAFMDKRLPFFMLPDRLFFVADIPLTLNGKVDKRQLMAQVVLEQAKTYLPPETETEQRVAAIWEALLDVSPVGAKDNFFRLGGHSLKAGQFINRLYKETGVLLAFSDVFHHAVLRQLAALIDKRQALLAQEGGDVPVQPAPALAFYPMSSPQKRSYLLHQAGGQELSYNMPEAFWINGQTDIAQLESAYAALIQRHEILRTAFGMRDGEPVQVIQQSVPFKIDYTEAGEEDITSLAAAFIRPFDLSAPPLLRGQIYRFASGRQLFLFDQHHIISDGISRTIFMTELARLYKGETLSPLAFQYKDFSVWQQSFLASRFIKEQETYWLQQFAEEVPGLNLQTDFQRPIQNTFSGKRQSLRLPDTLYTELEKAGRTTGCTMHQLLLGAFFVVLYKYCGQEDIVVGTPAAGRSRPEWEHLLGMFVNTLALRAYPEGRQTFRTFLEQVKEASINALKHQDYPFELLVDRLDLKRTPGANPLFGLMFSFLQDPAKPQLDGVLADPLNTLPITCKFDILLEAVQQDHSITLNLEYRTELFRDTTMAAFLDHYTRLLQRFNLNLDKPLAAIDILSPEEEQQLLTSNGKESIAAYPDCTLHSLFEAQVRRVPEKTALVWQHETLTYAALNRRAEQLAAAVRPVLAATGNPVVAVLLDRSPEMIIALLGILKAGGTYLPIDPDYPADRIQYMLDDSRAGLLITASAGVVVAGYAGQTIAMDQLDPLAVYTPVAVDSGDLAYIIYTSGSTGQPKGVMIEHRNVVQLFFNDRPLFDFTENDTWTMFHAYCFDFSVWEMYGALLFGGKLVLVPKATAQSAGDFLHLLQEQRVTVLNQTPGAFYNLSAAAADSFARVDTLRYVIFGGEALKPGKLRYWYEQYPSCKLINMYGITETTVHVTYKVITGQEINLNASNIGKPLPTLSLLVLDQDGRLVPQGAAGELYVGGAGLARGYLNKPELSKERFIDHPYVPGEKLYRTGDLARIGAGGDFEYLGRKDLQVKIRGFRIELGEIESKLLLHTAVKDTLVIDLEDSATGEKYLCAYMVATGKVSVTALRKHLSAFLPDYMIPAYFVLLDHFPLTANGKTDRKRLPDPVAFADMQATVSDLPQTETEKTLGQIWKAVLKRDRIGIQDNFFELGGHSLKATNAVARIFKSFRVNLPLEVFFKSPTIREQAAYIDGQQQLVAELIQPVAQRSFYPLTSSQKRLYLLHQMDAAAMGYNMPEAFRVRGKLDVKRLEQSLNALIDRHEVLRTAFEMCDGVPVQRVRDHYVFQVTHTKASATSVPELIRDFIRPFDLAAPPLLRAKLCDLGEAGQLLLLDMHHIISDGVSSVLFAEELNRLYQGESLEPLPVQYKEFAVWQQDYLASAAMAEQEQYWLQQFAAEVPVLNLQTDYPRPAITSFKGKRVYYRLPAALSSALEQLCSHRGYTLHQVLLAAFKVLLYKYSGNDDLVVGVPAAGRTRAELHNLLGVFINTLALRSYPSGEKLLGDFLEEIKQTSLDALKNQDYPFELLVDKLDIKRDRSRNPLFDIMFSFVHREHEGILLGDALLEPLKDIYDSSKFDLLLEGTKTGDGIELQLEYSTALFEASTVSRFLQHYVNLLQQIESGLDQRLADLSLLGPEEKDLLLATEHTGYPADVCLHQLFEEQVKRHPAKTALVGQQEEISYAGLDGMANRVAAAVSAALPGTRNPIVAVLLDRGSAMVATLLGILKAGAAYLPIDPDYPADRIRYMLEDSRAAALITHSDIAPVAGYEGPVIMTDRIGEAVTAYTPVAVQSTDLAYIIYTSGSTGNPKGVMIEHRNVVRLLFNDHNLFDFKETDTWTLFHSYCFDFSVWEMYGALLYGGKLVIVPKETAQNPAAFLELLAAEQVTVLNQTPGSFYNISAAEQERQEAGLALRYVIFGGEALKPAKLQSWSHRYPHCRLINMYGITETTVHVTYKEITEREIAQGASNIGKPIPTLSLCILDRDLNLVPAGVAGELCISGAGLARGYLNRPELTAERFTDHPYKPGEKLYRTGDLAKRLANGDIEYLGRIDHQVKIRGFRIELGEIESRLLTHPAVQDVLVTDLEDETGSRYLCAYLTANRDAGSHELREHLAAFLPDYMVPAFFVVLEQFPLTGNGKIDRRRLPEPQTSGLSTTTYQAPETLTEQKLAGLWIQLLRIPRAGRNDHFFERGGHSLKAAQLAALIHKTFHTGISIKDIFRTPRLNDMAALIHNSAFTAHHAIQRAPSRSAYPAASAEQRLFILNRMDDAGISYNIPGMYMLEGDLDLKRWNLALQSLIRRHDILRTAFVMEQGTVVQKIMEDVDFEVEIHNCADDDLDAFIHDFIRPFDLGEAPLLRVTLIRTGSGAYYFLFDIHHIISDGVSMDVFMQELAMLYCGSELPVLNIQARDFAVWQQQWLQTPQARMQEAFWKAQFEQEVPVLNMPADFMRPPVKSYEGALYRFAIPAPVAREIDQLGRENGVTPFMIMLAAFNILLAKYSGQDDIVIGTAVAGRSHADVQDLIGMFVNTLPLRNFPTPGKSFTDFIQEIRENCLQAFENQDYPFEALLDRLDVRRDRSRNPLFDYMITYRPEDKQELQFADLLLRQVPLPHHIAKMDLSLDICAAADGSLTVSVEYATKLYTAATIRRLAGHFNRILEQVTANPGTTIAAIGLITPQEKTQILQAFNDTDAAFAARTHGLVRQSETGESLSGQATGLIPGSARDVYSVFEENAKRYPDHIAVATEDAAISYRELQERVAVLAGTLAAEGCGPEKIIGVYTDRSIAMMTGILAIFKAGGAYLPIDPEYPLERIRYMLEDSGAIFVLTQKQHAAKLDFAPRLVLLDDPASFAGPAMPEGRNGSPGNLAYVIYTSGSTGKPKGVQIEHHSLYNFLFASAVNYSSGFSAADVCLSISSVSFDVTMLELFMPLVFGAKLVLVNREKLYDVRALAQVIVAQKITFCYIAPSLLQPLYEALKGSAPIALNKIDVGAEPIKDTVLELCCTLNEHMQIMNGYGPTEATVACSWYPYQPGNAKGTYVSIGKPIYNIRLYILDEHQQLLPVGVPGELCIAGAGLARGYLNNPELTAEKFVDNPFVPGTKLYRTGDLAKWRPDGNIDFIGRKDHQVKIRGFRIELGEIENKLMTYPGVQQALVMDKTDNSGNKFLCAYIVSAAQPDLEALRAHLATELPVYMIPAFFVALEQFPLTKSEKIDRRALPEPDIRQQRKGDGGPVEPANDTERQLLGIWQKVLGSDKIGVTDNFFQSGGNSLKIINMLSIMQQTFGDLLKVSDLFDKPSIREQAAVITHSQPVTTVASSKKIKRVEF